MIEHDRRVDQIRAHVAALARADAKVVAELVHEDFVQDWPQSGERVRGRTGCLRLVQSYPGGLPSVEIRRIVGSGDVWVVETIARYGDQPVHVVAVLEFRDGVIVHETDYFGEPFPAPAWRAELVERGETATV